MCLCLGCPQEKDEFVENILQDLQALGFKHDAFSHTSDHFLPMQECAQKLISAGVLYADDTPVDQMREVCSHLDRANSTSITSGTLDPDLGQISIT